MESVIEGSSAIEHLRAIIERLTAGRPADDPIVREATAAVAAVGSQLLARASISGRRQRIGRRVSDLDLTAARGPAVTLGAIARRSDIPVHILREMCEHGEIDGAYRFGKRGEWRIPHAMACGFVRRACRQPGSVFATRWPVAR